jgi:hypothetical protein
MYEPTKNQERKWSQFDDIEMPSDEEFKARWAKTHHGKTRGWGMMKRDWASSRMTTTREYQMGIWQGRVDAARGLDYSEERNENTYNLGYYRGYTNFQSDFCGFDRDTQARFNAKYVEV